MTPRSLECMIFFLKFLFQAKNRFDPLSRLHFLFRTRLETKVVRFESLIFVRQTNLVLNYASVESILLARFFGALRCIQKCSYLVTSFFYSTLKGVFFLLSFVTGLSSSTLHCEFDFLTRDASDRTNEFIHFREPIAHQRGQSVSQTSELRGPVQLIKNQTNSTSPIYFKVQVFSIKYVRHIAYICICCDGFCALYGVCMYGTCICVFKHKNQTRNEHNQMPNAAKHRNTLGHQSGFSILDTDLCGIEELQKPNDQRPLSYTDDDQSV